jgi:sarcosine oxidase delta subunit
MSSWYWECPICHTRINRNFTVVIEDHKREHPNNPAAFNNNFYEEQLERRKIHYGTRR